MTKTSFDSRRLSVSRRTITGLAFLPLLLASCRCVIEQVWLGGAMEPGPFTQAERLADLGYPFVLTDVIYSNVYSYHLIPFAGKGWISLDVSRRGSQIVALCLEKGQPCSVAFDKVARVAIIRGAVIDSVGLNQFEQFLFVEKPGDASVVYYATVIMLNGRAASIDTRATIKFDSGNPFCSKCDINDGRCTYSGKCLCSEGRMGRVCDKRIEKLRQSSNKFTYFLNPFEAVYIEDYYNTGARETVFNLSSPTFAHALLVINQGSSVDYSMALKENTAGSAMVFDIFQWTEGHKNLNFTIEKNWMILGLMNLSPTNEQFDISTYRDRQVSTDITSMILFIFLFSAIGILLILCVVGFLCKKRNLNRAARVGVAQTQPKEEELGKLDQAQIDKYLPILDLTERTAAFEFTAKDSCSICLESNEGEKPVRKVVFCGHIFHSECLLDWIQQKEFCPNCKTEFNRKAIKSFEMENAKNPPKIHITKRIWTKADLSRREGAPNLSRRENWQPITATPNETQTIGITGGLHGTSQTHESFRRTEEQGSQQVISHRNDRISKESEFAPKDRVISKAELEEPTSPQQDHHTRHMPDEFDDREAKVNPEILANPDPES